MDVNSDELPDFLVWDEGVTHLYINGGDGNFSAGTQLGADGQFATRSVRNYVGSGVALGTFYVPKYLESFRVADINSDGKVELLVPGRRLITSCGFVNGRNLCGDELYGAVSAGTGEYPQVLINAYFYDDSVYEYDAIYFDLQADGTYQARRESTPLIGSASQAKLVDAFGDGLQDMIFTYGGRYPGSWDHDPNWIQNPSSSMLGTNYGAYIVKNYGSGNGTTGYVPSDMLTAVENGYDARDEWTYRPLPSGDPTYHSSAKPFYEPDFDYLKSLSEAAQEDHFHFTSSMYVVAEHRRSNGISGMNATQYRYKGALYNNKGRGRQGFRSIITEDLAKGVEIQEDFHQVFPLAGKLHGLRKWALEDRYSDSSNTDAFEETSIEWQIWPEGGHGAPIVVVDPEDSWNVSANDPYFVGPSSQSTVRRTLTKSGSIRSELFTNTQNSTFDRWGNLLLTTTTYSEPGNSHLVATSTETQYVNADVVNWWINKPFKKTATKHAIQNRVGVSIASGTYLEQSVIIDYLSWDAAARKPKRVKTTPSSGKWTHTDTQYNSDGLPTSVSITAEGATDPRLANTAYSSDGYFPKFLTNSLGHTVTTEVNPKFGVPDSVTDANGLVTSYGYDAYGRPLKLTAPSRNGLTAAPEIHTSLQWCDAGTCSGVTYAVFRKSQQQAGVPTKIIYYDALGRAIRQDIQAFDSMDWIVSRTEFDELGQTVFESGPYFLNSPNHYGTRYLDYDILGRPLHKTVDRTNGQQLDTRYTHEQGTDGFTTNIEANGRSMSRTYNGLDQLIETVDALNGTTKYAYDGAGNPIVLQDANANRIIAKYNALNQKEWVDDPNMGLKSFTYTGFGEVETETDANMDVTSYEYDELGRLESRSVNGVEEAKWIFDTAANGIGLPHVENRSDSAFSRSYEYDTLSRPVGVTTTIDGENFVVRSHYDSHYGRLKGLGYPSGLTLEYGYSAGGYRALTNNAASGYRYREITALDARGQWTEASFAASNYMVSRAFYRETGQMEGTAFDSLVQSHQTIAYSYDDFGNLEQQTVSVPSESPSMNTETYLYDALNRLDYSSRTNGPSIDYTYDPVGNLLKKDDFATSYSYTGGNGGPNAVHSVSLVGGGTKSFGYDANGNRTHENGGEQIWYNAYNKPIRINRNGVDLRFFYGADQNRYKQVNQTNGKSTFYIDKLFEKTINGSEIQYRHFIEDIAVVTITENQSGIQPKIGFTHRDRLGSTVAVGDESGNLRENHSFDPFGKPRLGNIQDKLTARLESLFTTRGFTDHEHLDKVDLIHMNGRAYDYNLGRFLSVDPIIQSPGNSQSLNPYSYIMNNPLAGTDPSGYVSAPNETDKIKQAGRERATRGQKLPPGVYRHAVGFGYTIIFGPGGDRSNTNGAQTGSDKQGGGKTPGEIGSRSSISSDLEHGDDQRNEGSEINDFSPRVSAGNASDGREGLSAGKQEFVGLLEKEIVNTYFHLAERRLEALRSGDAGLADDISSAMNGMRIADWKFVDGRGPNGAEALAEVRFGRMASGEVKALGVNITFFRGSFQAFLNGSKAARSLGYFVDLKPGMHAIRGIIGHEVGHTIPRNMLRTVNRKLTPLSTRPKERAADTFLRNAYPGTY